MINYKNIISTGIVLFLVLNIFYNVFGILTDSLYYKGILIIENFLFFLALIKLNGRLKENKAQWSLIFMVLIFQISGYYFNSLLEEYICLDLHRLAAFICMLWVLWMVPQYTYIDSRYFCRLLYFVIGIGIIACIYNVMTNWEVLKTFDLKIIMNYTFKFKAFFNSRSNFCLILCICCSICLYLFESNKFKYNYLILYFFFFANIVLTNARTSIIVMACVTGFYMFQNKMRRFYVVMFLTALIFVIPWEQVLAVFIEFKSKYYLLFERHNSVDFSNGRFKLWKNALDGTNAVSLFIGHGIGAKDAYLSYINAEVLSFHNMWIDIFFEGGIFLILFYLGVIRNVIRLLKKSTLSLSKKHLFYNFFLILILSGMGDAIASLFLLDTFSIVTTLLFITCPLCLINEEMYIKKFE